MIALDLAHAVLCLIGTISVVMLLIKHTSLTEKLNNTLKSLHTTVRDIDRKHAVLAKDIPQNVIN